MKLFIIIPAYNEEKRIGKTLESYSQFFNKLRREKKLDYEILVVINNTTDKTEKIVKYFRSGNKLIKYMNIKQKGKGLAVINGFKEAIKNSNNALIGFVDADMATSPEEYYKLVKNIWNYDGAIADRYMKESKVIPSFSFRRVVVSRVFNFLVRVLFLLPYKDTQTGAKVFKKETIEKILPKLGMTQWAFDIDLLYSIKNNNLKINSVPTIWYEKEGGTLRMAKTSIEMFFSIIQLRIFKSPFKRLLHPIKPLINILWNQVK